MESSKLHKNKPILDRSIWMTLSVFAFIGLFFTAYRWFNSNDNLTTPFMVEDSRLTVGKIVSFKDTTHGATNWQWTFGDESSKTGVHQEALHVYKHPGTYTVTLRVNKGPAKQKKITIENKKIAHSNKYPSFTMPPTANVGERVRFEDHTKGAQNWQWTFGESMQIDATSKSPVYIFQSPGTKTITLIVNGKDQYATQKRLTIFVKPVKKPKFEIKPHKKITIKVTKPKDSVQVSSIPIAPPIETKQKKESPEINRIQLEDYLLQVAEEKRKPKTLKPYFCKGYDTRIRINGQEMTLQYLLQKLKGRKVSIKNLEVLKNKKTRCINYVKIDYKKDKVLGIF